MPDTKEGREKQAKRERQRRNQRDIEETRERMDELPPSGEDADESDEGQREKAEVESPPECHRRGCSRPAEFVVLERYQEETGHGAVEAKVSLCLEHADEESPTNLDRAYEDYVFRVVPIEEA